MAPDTHPSASRDGALPKSVLICPTCGHESGPEGDWHERRCETAGGPKLALVCPECSTEITYRPVATGSERERVLPSLSR